VAIVRRNKRSVRWLTRKGGVDFGPFTTEQVVEMIRAREVQLGTMVCDVAVRQWEPLGSHATFRAHYAEAEQNWASAAADEHARQLRTKRLLTGGAWQLVLVGTLVVLAFGGWMAWRMSRAEPTGILEAVRIAQPPTLPAAIAAVTPVPLAIPAGTAVRRLREVTNYDTSGVGLEGQGGDLVTTMSFDDDAKGLSDAAFKKIVAVSRRKLAGCAQAAAVRSERFTGTRVSFVVSSGGLGSFTVGSEALGDRPFKACIKRALKGISVPSFQGSQRKVTIPLSVRR
jgi:hypothetical protein